MKFLLGLVSGVVVGWAAEIVVTHRKCIKLGVACPCGFNRRVEGHVYVQTHKQSFVSDEVGRAIAAHLNKRFKMMKSN